MPIRPENKALYPDDWKEISHRVRTEAKWLCENCGAQNYHPHPITGSRVVLTVAHLDHDPTNNARDNLRALCQKCHNDYDRAHRAETRARTEHTAMMEAASAAGQQDIFSQPDAGEATYASWSAAIGRGTTPFTRATRGLELAESQNPPPLRWHIGGAEPDKAPGPRITRWAVVHELNRRNQWDDITALMNLPPPPPPPPPPRALGTSPRSPTPTYPPEPWNAPAPGECRIYHLPPTSNLTRKAMRPPAQRYYSATGSATTTPYTGSLRSTTGRPRRSRQTASHGAAPITPLNTPRAPRLNEHRRPSPTIG